MEEAKLLREHFGSIVVFGNDVERSVELQEWYKNIVKQDWFPAVGHVDPSCIEMHESNIMTSLPLIQNELNAFMINNLIDIVFEYFFPARYVAEEFSPRDAEKTGSYWTLHAADYLKRGDCDAKKVEKTWCGLTHTRAYSVAPAILFATVIESLRLYRLTGCFPSCLIFPEAANEVFVNFRRFCQAWGIEKDNQKETLAKHLQSNKCIFYQRRKGSCIVDPIQFCTARIGSRHINGWCHGYISQHHSDRARDGLYYPDRFKFASLNNKQEEYDDNWRVLFVSEPVRKKWVDKVRSLPYENTSIYVKIRHAYFYLGIFSGLKILLVEDISML